jgi:hypothetical protein
MCEVLAGPFVVREESKGADSRAGGVFPPLSLSHVVRKLIILPEELKPIKPIWHKSHIAVGRSGCSGSTCGA